MNNDECNHKLQDYQPWGILGLDQDPGNHLCLVTLHIPTVWASMLSYFLAIFLWQQLLPNAVSCDIHVLTKSWAVTVKSLLSQKARLPWSPMLLHLLWGVGRATAPAAAASCHLCCLASRGTGSCYYISALGATGQETREAFLPNWAMIAAEWSHLLWRKGWGHDGSLQQAGFDVQGHSRLDLFRLFFSVCVPCSNLRGYPGSFMASWGFLWPSALSSLIAQAKESQSEVIQDTLETAFLNSCVLALITPMLSQHRTFFCYMPRAIDGSYW